MNSGLERSSHELPHGDRILDGPPRRFLRDEPDPRDLAKRERSPVSDRGSGTAIRLEGSHGKRKCSLLLCRQR